MKYNQASPLAKDNGIHVSTLFFSSIEFNRKGKHRGSLSLAGEDDTQKLVSLLVYIACICRINLNKDIYILL